MIDAVQLSSTENWFKCCGWGCVGMSGGYLFFSNVETGSLISDSMFARNLRVYLSILNWDE